MGIDDPAESPIRLAPDIECALILCSQNTGPDMMIAARKMGTTAEDHRTGQRACDGSTAE
jgi:hypothetical protein